MDVLLIDDAPELAEVISLCFEMRWPKSTILTAGTAAEGVRLARTSNPDVVILDIGLPDRDGFQVCREIRSFSLSTFRIRHSTSSPMATTLDGWRTCRVQDISEM